MGEKYEEELTKNTQKSKQSKKEKRQLLSSNYAEKEKQSEYTRWLSHVLT